MPFSFQLEKVTFLGYGGFYPFPFKFGRDSADESLWGTDFLNELYQSLGELGQFREALLFEALWLS